MSEKFTTIIIMSDVQLWHKMTLNPEIYRCEKYAWAIEGYLKVSRAKEKNYESGTQLKITENSSFRKCIRVRQECLCRPLFLQLRIRKDSEQGERMNERERKRKRERRGRRE